MRKINKLLLTIMFVLSIAACSGEEDSDLNELNDEQQTEVTEEAEKEEVEQKEIEEEATLSREDELSSIVAERVESQYNSTSIRNIRINEDMGTGEGYIVLVDLSFDAKNRPGTAKDMIEMYSSDLAATLGEEPDVNEVTVFWEVPYLQESGNIAKIATQRTDGGMAFTEEWYDPNIFE